MKSRLDSERIRESVGQIDPVFLNSPLFTSEQLNERLGVELLLKDETRNPVKCFKGRGAEYLAAQHPPGRPIICASDCRRMVRARWLWEFALQRVGTNLF